MPSYGLITIDDNQLKELKDLEKDKNCQKLLSDLEKSKTQTGLLKNMADLINLKFSIDAAPQTKAQKTTSQHLQAAIKILLTAGSRQKPVQIMVKPLIDNTLIPQLIRINEQVTNQDLKAELNRISILLKHGLLPEACQAFDNLDPALLTDNAQKIMLLKQQAQLIQDSVPPEQLDIKSTIKEVDNSLSETFRLYKTGDAGKHILRPQIFKQLDILFDIIENSSQVESRDLAISELSKLFQGIPADLLPHYLEASKTNQKRVSFIKIMQNALSGEMDLNSRILINFLLNPHLTFFDIIPVAPVLIARLDINQVLAKLNAWIDLFEDDTLKLQVAQNSANIIQQMILADRLGSQIPANFIHSASFQAFYQKVALLNPAFAQHIMQSLGSALNHPNRDEAQINKTAQHPLRADKMPVDIEAFLQRVSTLSSTSPEYQLALQSTAESLFLLQAGMWIKIKPADLQDENWRKKAQTTNVAKFPEFAAIFDKFVKNAIAAGSDLQAKRDRAVFFVNLMNAALFNPHFIDFNTANAIYSALVSPAAVRGQPTVESLLELENDQKFKAAYTQAMDKAKSLLHYTKSYQNYREALNQAIATKKPHIPLLHVIIADIMFLDENKSKNLAFWLQSRGKGYEYIDSTTQALTDYLTKPSAVITSTLARIVNPVQTQSAPGRLESAAAAAATTAPPVLSSTTAQRKSLSSEPAFRPRAAGTPPRRRVTPSTQDESGPPRTAIIGRRAAPLIVTPQAKDKSADISHESGTHSPTSKPPGHK